MAKNVWWVLEGSDKVEKPYMKCVQDEDRGFGALKLKLPDEVSHDMAVHIEISEPWPPKQPIPISNEI